MEQFEDPAARMAGGHQSRYWPESAAPMFVAANPQKNVVEKIEPIRTGFKQTEALGRTLWPAGCAG